MRIRDTHAHYDDEAFDEDRGELLITFMRESGFIRMTSAYSSTPAFHGKKRQN